MIDFVKKIIIGDKQESPKRNFIWNMIGSGIYALASMVLIIAVVRAVGEKEGGIFAIALTISQMLIYFAYFEMRTYQVTDAENEYQFKDYYTAKLFTCMMMVIVSLIYAGVKGYQGNKLAIILLMCFYKAIDGFADVFEGTFQKEGRLDLAGKSMGLRTVISAGTLMLVVFVTKDLVMALIAACITAILGVVVFNIMIIGEYKKIELARDLSVVKRVLVSCFPLFTGVFLWTYILSASRIAIDANMSSEYQTYYSALFMPVSVINLFCSFIFRPVLNSLALFYKNGETKRFRNSILRNMGLMMAFTVVCMLGAYILGIPVLSALYGCNLSDYRFELVFLLMAGGFNALGVIMYYVLTIMRRPKSISLGYLVSALLAAAISSPLVRIAGIKGAAFSYFLVVMFQCVLFAFLILRKDNAKGD